MKICSECHVEFQPGSHKGLVCSFRCKNARRRRLEAEKRPIKICQFCKKDYKPFRIDQKFCSQKCLQTYHNKIYYSNQSYMDRLNTKRRERYKTDSDYRKIVYANWKKSYQKNKEKRLAYRHNYRITHDFDVIRNLINAETIKAVFARDNYTCQYCGKYGGRLTIDHKLALIKGGNNYIENLCVACRSCNCSKQDKTPEEFLAYKNARSYEIP